MKSTIIKNGGGNEKNTDNNRSLRCGKTNYAINLAFRYAAQGFKTAIADMDIVNPYFRTADFRDKFKKNNISYAGTAYANTKFRYTCGLF